MNKLTILKTLIQSIIFNIGYMYLIYYLLKENRKLEKEKNILEKKMNWHTELSENDLKLFRNKKKGDVILVTELETPLTHIGQLNIVKDKSLKNKIEVLYYVKKREEEHFKLITSADMNIMSERNKCFFDEYQWIMAYRIIN